IDNTFTELQLTSASQTGVRSAFLLPDLDPGQAVYSFSVKWNSQIYGNFPNAADGFSVNFGQIGGLNLASSAYAQESGYGVGLSFGIQTYTSGSPGFYIRVNGNTVANVPFNPTLEWGANNNTRHFFELDWNYLKGMTVRIDGVAILSNVATPGFTPRAGDRLGFAGRCGALAEEVRVDNIVAMTGGNLVTYPLANVLDSNPDNAAAALDGNTSTYVTLQANAGYIFGYGPHAGIIKAYALTSSPANSPQNSLSDPANWFIFGDAFNDRSFSSIGQGYGSFLNRQETRAWGLTNDTPEYGIQIEFAANNGSTNTSIAELKYWEFIPLTANVTATTLPASNVIVSAATLNGSVGLSSLAAGAWFQYGTTAAYGSVTPIQLLGSGSNTVPVAAALASLAPSATYHYRLVATNAVTTNYGADMTFITFPADGQVDITEPYDPIQLAGGGSSPAGQEVGYATDDSLATKYLNFGKLNTGLTIRPSFSSRVAQGLTLVSAPDSPERDPASYVLSGSSDGTHFTTIASGQVPIFPQRSYIQSFSFTNAAAYPYYKLIFPTVANSSSANSMQIGEVELLSYSELAVSGGAAVVTLPNGASNVNGTAALFDRQVASGQTFVVTGVSNSVTVETPVTVGASILKGVEVIGGEGEFTNPGQQASSVTVSGSADGVNYVTLTNAMLRAPSSDMEIQGLPLDANNNVYTKYRITFGPPVSGTTLAVGELRLFGVWSGIAISNYLAASGASTATVAADISGARGSASAWFEWGGTAHYGYSTAPQDVSGSAGVTAQATLAGLAPGYAYHFRAVVSNSFGLSYGSDATIPVPVSALATAAPVDLWGGLACSADGSVVIAVTQNNGGSGNYETISTNGGLNWTPGTFTGDQVFSAACSADGKRMVLAGGAGGGSNALFLSTNAGATWGPPIGPANQSWAGAVCSANGQTLVAASMDTGTNNGSIFISRDGGTTWNPTTQAGNWYGVSCSADASVIVALGTSSGGDFLSVSTNGGAGWATVSPPSGFYWSTLALSGDGSMIYAALLSGAYPVGTLQVSHDDGQSWLPTGSGTGPWGFVSCSFDGSRVLLISASDYFGASTNNDILLSTDGGASFAEVGAESAPWEIAAMAANGNVGYAVGGSAYPPPVPTAVLKILVPDYSTAPTLTINAGNTNAIISWPNAPAFGLETSASLTAGSWGATPGTPFSTNGVTSQTVTAGSAKAFFRLRQQ
ncbi:MAG TPA: hypothetical protein VHB20_01710, partial [Verrucomicrobiae bacterium]|nr:hypothetical protein [Verrucomicrobiae bacterium]